MCQALCKSLGGLTLFGMEMEKYMVRGVDGKWEKTGGKEEGETGWFIK